MAGILAWFWNERFWLPHNVTWADLQSTEEAAFPQAEDLYLAFPLAFCIFMIRLLFERFIAKPCALGLKVQANGPQKAQPNAILEKVFTAITKHPDEKRLEGLSKQLDWDVRSIQRWFRQRRNQEKPSTLRKFCESIYLILLLLLIVMCCSGLCPAVGCIQELLGQVLLLTSDRKTAVSPERESIKENLKFLEVTMQEQQTLQ
ncbi:ceramide synthase 6-like protein [Pitangus sulphuratus]|nr:ceramide synthase 6-like protein [Pitangus sulphuratus]